MKTGPAAKPTKLKKLEGNAGKRALNHNEPQPDPELLPCPSFIKGAARKEWHRITPELYQLGLLTTVDRAALAGYCIAWGQLEEVEKELARMKRQGKKHRVMNGMVSLTVNGNIIIEPLLSVRKQAMEQMYKFLSEFGMTPASRSKVNSEPVPGGRKARSRMQELMEGTAPLTGRRN